MRELTNRQQQIIDVSLELLYEKGVSNLTIRKISGKLGLTEGAIYRHFVSKDEIIQVIIEQLCDYYKGAIEKIMEGESSRDKLKNNYVYWSGILSESPMFADFFLSDSFFKFNKENLTIIWKARNEYRISFIEVLDKAKQEGLIKAELNTEHLAFIIIGTLRILIQRWSKADNKNDIKKQSEEVWNTISTMIFKGDE